MDELTALGIMRRLFPRLAAVLVGAAFYFAPDYSTAVIMRVANERAEPITSALKETFKSSFADPRQHRPQQKAR